MWVIMEVITDLIEIDSIEIEIFSSIDSNKSDLVNIILIYASSIRGKIISSST